MLGIGDENREKDFTTTKKIAFQSQGDSPIKVIAERERHKVLAHIPKTSQKSSNKQLTLCFLPPRQVKPGNNAHKKVFHPLGV